MRYRGWGEGNSVVGTIVGRMGDRGAENKEKNKKVCTKLTKTKKTQKIIHDITFNVSIYVYRYI